MLGLRIAGIFFSFVASAAGCLVPFAWPWHEGSLRPVKMFSAGVICSLSLAHILNEAAVQLDQVTEYPVGGVCALAGLLGMMIFEHSMGSSHSHGEQHSELQPHCSTHHHGARVRGGRRGGSGGEERLLENVCEVGVEKQVVGVAEAGGQGGEEAVCGGGEKEGGHLRAQDGAQQLSSPAPRHQNEQHVHVCMPPVSAEDCVPASAAEATRGSDGPRVGVAAQDQHAHVCVPRLDAGAVASSLADHDGGEGSGGEVAAPCGEGQLGQSGGKASISAQLNAVMFELSCLLHSVFIGASIGLTVDEKTQAVLLLAVCFHQVLEGVSLGCVLKEAAMGKTKNATMILSFAAAVPLGIIIGLALQQHGEYQSSNLSIVVSGMTSAFSGGMLLYIALFQIIAEELTRQDLYQAPWHVRVGIYLSLVSGAASMCLMAIWL